jgi:TolB-like protein/DNA-binding SARP family transcriptional activator
LLRILTLGGCSLTRDGVRLDALSGQRKGLALLALVAAAGERGISRERLATYLWPESDEDRARMSLKQLVHSLRSLLKEPDLLLPSAELRLDPDVVTSDVADLRAALKRGELEAAVALHAGPFLDGFSLRGADEFERWAAAERVSLERDVAGALYTLADRASAAGDHRSAVGWWRRLANMEPLSARSATGLMRGLEQLGDRTAALQHGRVYEELVRLEVGAEPDPSVVALMNRLRTSTSAEEPSRGPSPGSATPEREDPGPDPPLPSPATSGPTPHRVATATAAKTRARRSALVVATLGAFAIIAVARSRVLDRRPPDAVDAAGGRTTIPSHGPSIAVLPFVNTSADPANEPFSDGLTDELIATLSGIDGLRVAGRTSSFALKGKGLTLQAVAETLGVASVLEGSVRREQQRLKVAVQLVNTADGVVRWSQTYDRQLVDAFAVQEEIARAIGGVLRVKLVDASPRDTSRRPTADPVAYEHYLRARHILNARQSREGMLHAARYFAQAIARDSTYANAYAGLSDVHTRMAVFGYARPREEFLQARTYASRALALDSTSAQAHAALGHVLCVHDYDWAAAEREFRRALSLNPGYTTARTQFAVCLASQRRISEGLAQLDTARTIDPLAAVVPNMAGRLLVIAGEPDRAIRSLNEALELNPQLDLAQQMLGHAYLLKRMYPEAFAAFRRAAAVSGIRDSAQLAFAYAEAGQRAEARRIVSTLTAPGRYVPPYHIAMAYAGLGDADEAFRWLERAYAERASFMNGVMIERAFEPLHSDPRWGKLAARMRLASGSPTR